MSSEYSIVGRAARALSTAAGVEVAVVNSQPPVAEIKVNGELLQGLVFNNVRAGGVDAILSRLKSLDPVMGGAIFTDYINPNIRDTLLRKHINYIDCCGNCHIHISNIFISIGGNKPETSPIAETNKAFESAGMKLILALLSRPGLEKHSYRDLSSITGISVGAIGNAMTGLINLGFIQHVGMDNGRYLTSKEKLLTRWMNTYIEKVRPKLLIGTFSTNDLDWWKDFDLTLFHGRWGGEVGVAKYRAYLGPAAFTVYMEEAYLYKLLSAARLRKIEGCAQPLDGQVDIYKPYMPQIMLQNEEQSDVVNPLIIYAELMASDDSRNHEAAQDLYDEVLYKYFHED